MGIARRALLGAVPGLIVGARRGDAADAKTRAALVVVTGTASVTNLTMAELRSLYTGGLLRDAKGVKLVPINQPPLSADRVLFDSIVLSLEPEEVGRFWIDRRIRGLGMPPRSFEGPKLLQKLVDRFPGSVTYVRSDQLTGDAQPVRISGLAHTDRNYPL